MEHNWQWERLERLVRFVMMVWWAGKHGSHNVGSTVHRLWEKSTDTPSENAV